MEDQPVTYYQILITDGKVGLPSLPVTADVYSMSGTLETADAVTTEIGGGVYMWSTTSQNIYCVVFKTTIDGTPRHFLGTPIKEPTTMTEQTIWSYHNRTLVQAGVSLELPVVGSNLILYRDATNVIVLSGLGDLSNRTNVWFTIKKNLDNGDDEAIVQITENDGVLYINKTPHTNPNDSLAVTDDGTATITLSAETSVNLPYIQVTPIEWDLKVSFTDGQVLPIQVGTALIKATATRSIPSGEII